MSKEGSKKKVDWDKEEAIGQEDNIMPTDSRCDLKKAASRGSEVKSLAIQPSYSFDDLLILPNYSEVMPTQVSTSTYIIKGKRPIMLERPFISAAMDTVTEAKLSIAIAGQGGIGCLHKNMSIEEQAHEVRKVKKHEGWIVYDPITIGPDETVAEAIKLMRRYNYSGIPVVGPDKEILGIVTNRDIRFGDGDRRDLVTSVMTNYKKLITVGENVSKEEAKHLLHEHRVEKLVVVGDNQRCVGLITVKDIEKSSKFPNATRDSKGRLRVAAAIGVGEIERADSLIKADVDIIVVDSAHGHSQRVLDTIRILRAKYPDLRIIGGNVVTEEGAEALIKAGADAVKVGVGPGSICTTRIISGVGIPQFSAIQRAAVACKHYDIPLIADGGIKYSGDVAKAIAAGADAVMIGSMFAGTEESPGEIILYHGRSYKSYRGMGSLGAMQKGSADRYSQDAGSGKLVPEGVEGRVVFRGPVAAVIHQLNGGLRAAMGYTGNKNIEAMKNDCQFTLITNAGLRESHTHDIIITHESPNYSTAQN